MRAKGGMGLGGERGEWICGPEGSRASTILLGGGRVGLVLCVMIDNDSECLCTTRGRGKESMCFVREVIWQEKPLDGENVALESLLAH